MKNDIFELEISSESGLRTSLSLSADLNKANFISEDRGFGGVNCKGRKFSELFRLTELSVEDNISHAVYENSRLRVERDMYFSPVGNLVMRYEIKNLTHTVYCLCRDNLGIEIPFNDKYTNADDCMQNRVHTHIWCGRNVSWMNALRMGESKYNLGLFLTEGSLVSYSQYECKTNVRGYFELEPETVLLNSMESYVVKWEIFPCEDSSDFFRKLSSYRKYVGITAKHYTVFLGEEIEFSVNTAEKGLPRVFLGKDELEVNAEDEGYFVRYLPRDIGEYRFTVKVGEVETYAEFAVKTPFSALTEKRVRFIVDHQQCLDKNSPLYGAYLVYDNRTGTQYFDYFNTDHNACRERLNMVLVIVKYLQKHEDQRVRASLDLFIRFMFREFYDEVSGDVYNNIGKCHDFLRLYNAPGVMLLFAELYLLTLDDRYLDHIVKLADKYYSIGGEKCYSNAVSIGVVMEAFERSNRKEGRERVLSYFRRHVDNMVNNGLSYPKHEVNYEQTIVTPAVKCIAEMGMYSEDKAFYVGEAKKHIACLERFSGHQPSFHLNEIAIRFWDDYWFGKSGCFGDTLPHHLSCLTARAYMAYAKLSGDFEWIERAEECLRNCLCLIKDNGEGSVAYVYPHTVNGADGEFYDEWANDQDLSLYDGMCFSDIIKVFTVGG